MAADKYLTYWMTRNSICGVLSDAVDVWLTRPIRMIVDEKILWHADKYYGRWNMDEAYRQARGGVPEDDRQCTRIGYET